MRKKFKDKDASDEKRHLDQENFNKKVEKHKFRDVSRTRESPQRKKEEIMPKLTYLIGLGASFVYKDAEEIRHIKRENVETMVCRSLP